MSCYSVHEYSVHEIESGALSDAQRDSLRDLFANAWRDGTFTEEDWRHAMGGVHFIIEEAGEIVSHASVVERGLHTGPHVLPTGYVEAVATRPSHRRRGLASAIMRAVGEYIDAHFPLGALDTGESKFYERLGWRVWQGPTGVRKNQGIIRTAEEDGLVMVRVTPATPDIDLTAPISCDWRPGDAW